MRYGQNKAGAIPGVLRTVNMNGDISMPIVVLLLSVYAFSFRVNFSRIT
jgi:hypothetical protein